MCGRRGSDARSELSFRKAADSFHHSVGTCLIIKCAGNADATSNQFKALVVNCSIANANEGFGLLLVLYAKIDPYFVGLGHFLAILRAHQVYSAFTCDSFDNTIFSEYRNASTRDHCLVMPAEGIKIDEALIVYISNN